MSNQAKFKVVCHCGDPKCPVHWFDNEADAVCHTLNRDAWPQIVYKNGKEIYRNKLARDDDDED